eukprot:CAMPEP_0203938406 /NCGR_PEP_ID=MMETSP0359-20131031/75443_1 /ASSEMBLY_ACC=CAM_ASM_000338 /TAXON_ID=268821 /ORGANISM="Scrippsiella Hangoei, Strain SHTV-5" /LENGTH=46 /DNA_ID= /DNA_START= /DNA_END= /DNA_ORIENTATION=
MSCETTAAKGLAKLSLKRSVHFMACTSKSPSKKNGVPEAIKARACK